MEFLFFLFSHEFNLLVLKMLRGVCLHTWDILELPLLGLTESHPRPRMLPGTARGDVLGEAEALRIPHTTQNLFFLFFVNF